MLTFLSFPPVQPHTHAPAVTADFTLEEHSVHPSVERTVVPMHHLLYSPFNLLFIVLEAYSGIFTSADSEGLYTIIYSADDESDSLILTS